MGRSRLLICMLCVPAILASPSANAQAAAQNPMPDWQKKAGGAMQFDVASVKLNKDNNPRRSTNFALDPSDFYENPGGLLRANDWRVEAYIGFAYKLAGNQADILERQLPEWALTERFDIEAHVDGAPTKDQMRLMMQALLKDRFKLALHFENREVPVLVMELTKPGKLGPNLRPSPAGSTCADPAPPDFAGVGCGGIGGGPSKIQGCRFLGARNIPMKLFVESIPELGPLDRPVLDRTGLTGNYDFRLDFLFQSNSQLPPGAGNSSPDCSAPSIITALKEQMGLKLTLGKGPIEQVVIDHIEHPTAN
jgi:uncharacterized protein (TIGR03435 family)